MKTFCENLKEHATKLNSYEKKENAASGKEREKII